MRVLTFLLALLLASPALAQSGAVSRVTVINSNTAPVPVTVLNPTEEVTLEGPVAVTDNGGSLTVDGAVTVSDGTGPLTIDGTVSLGGSPSVSVSSLPAITGSVSITNLPSSQSVSGTVTANQGGTWNVGLTGTLPAFGATPTFNCGTGCYPATQPVSGTIAVSNSTLAVTQSGSWNVGLTGTLPAFAATPTVNVANFPSSQATTVSGTVQVADNAGSLTVDTGTAGQPLNTINLPTNNAAAALTPVDALATTGLLVATGARNFYSASLVAAGSTTFFIVADLAAVPASGTSLNVSALLHCIRVDANGLGSVGSDIPDRASSGVVLLASTSCGVYTPVANAPVYMRGRAL